MLRTTVQDAEETGQALEVVTAVVRLLRQAAASAPSRSDRLSLTEFRVLKRLRRGLRLASDLAASLDVTPATISSVVEALVRRGLVQRQDSQADRRAVPLALTDPGGQVLSAAYQRQHDALARVVSGLRPGERRALGLSLAALSRVLAQENGS